MLYKDQHVCVCENFSFQCCSGRNETNSLLLCRVQNKRTRQIKYSYSGIIWNKIIIIRWSSPHSMAESKASEWNGSRLYSMPYCLLCLKLNTIRFNEKVYFSFVYKCENSVVSIIVFSFLFGVCYFDFAQSNIYWAKNCSFCVGMRIETKVLEMKGECSIYLSVAFI